MKSKVYYIDFRATAREGLTAKIARLLEVSGMGDVLKERDLTAVKIHFGEKGNFAFINPLYIKRVVQSVREAGATPFLTDTNTLYSGTRSDSVSHIRTAVSNGFAFPVVDDTPVIIADGLRGRSETKVAINKERFDNVYIGNEIYEADSLISVAHFKGHELAGFGGALKNLAMGCASRRGKLAQHSTLSPRIKQKLCVGCGDCTSHCSQEAITVVDGKARIDDEKCIGCGECILICPTESIQIRWNQAIPVFLKNLTEYAYGALQNKQGKSFFINFITDVSPACDCLPYNDSPIVRNVGILASKDPVAIDQASVDLVNMQEGISGSRLEKNLKPGEDKFKGLYPGVDWPIQLEYAQELGMGSREYELEKIESLRWKNESCHGAK